MATQAHSGHRTPADDVLDYAMTISLFATIAITISFIAAGLAVFPIVLGAAIFGGVWTFTITPHLIAYWLNIPVDTLLDTDTTHTYDFEETETA